MSARFNESDLPLHIRRQIASKTPKNGSRTAAANKRPATATAKKTTPAQNDTPKAKRPKKISPHPEFLKRILNSQQIILVSAKIKSPINAHEKGLARLIKKPDRYSGNQEHYLQVSICYVLSIKHPEIYEMMLSTPNGGYRPNSTGGEMTEEGLKTGYPDISIDIPALGFHGLRIELKREEGGELSEKQRVWLARLNLFGYKAALCTGWEEAWSVLNEYIEGIYERFTKSELRRIIEETKNAA